MAESHKKKTLSCGEFRVAASPFNAIKFELGVIFLVGFLLMLVLGRVLAGKNGLQLAWLLGYGCAAAAWLIVRVRFVTRRALQGEGGDGKKQDK